VSRFQSKDELVIDIAKERVRLDELLAEIPAERKTEEVVDGLSVKDLLAHRTEWSRMMIRWYTKARAGGTPAVPTEQFKWNQLKELNANIQVRFADVPLDEIEQNFGAVQDDLDALVAGMTEEELFTKKYYAFTGSSDLATYVNSATASHYRSAARLIRKWWKANA
jgi:hypothetical protein